ncbi:hypothetical protein M9H77_34516 [Catharanthus roseus]|uniref:Uncharacterized protein n=1 Tax=Catharanthus roseus TaxID=4058 RepID=A0ACB9ZML8_CATRO|nr:hypothetical protein M9H77_34516 [Catharanthus roseus]
MLRLAKEVLNPVLPEDPRVTLPSPPKVAVTKGQKKTDSTKRDKSHWEHVSIAHQKIQNRVVQVLGLVAVQVQVLILVLVEEVGRLVAVGVGTENVAVTNWEEGSAPPEYWMDTLDHLYVITNTFNLCVVFLARLESTIVLPLVSNMDGHTGTIFIGLIEELQHFIQLQLVDGCPLPLLQPYVAWRELPGHYSHWEYFRDSEYSGECGESMTLSVSAMVPRAIVPRRKCSSRRTSYCSSGGVPPEAG